MGLCEVSVLIGFQKLVVMQIIAGHFFYARSFYTETACGFS